MNNFNSDKIFLYSFEKEKNKYIQKRNINFRLNVDDKMINVGNGDIIVYSEYYLNGREINFPKESFDLSKVNVMFSLGKVGNSLYQILKFSVSA